METIDKIKNAYDTLVISCVLTEERQFKFVFFFKNINAFMTSEVGCGKYAKFLINDFKALENKYGMSVYTELDPNKVKCLYAISEQYMWFSRKELVEFLEREFNVLAAKLESCGRL